MNEQRSYAGLISAIVGIVALLAKAHAGDPAPVWHWVQVLASDVPNFTAMLGYVVPTVAIVITTVTHPAPWVRDRWDDLTHRVALWWTSRSRA